MDIEASNVEVSQETPTVNERETREPVTLSERERPKLKDVLRAAVKEHSEKDKPADEPFKGSKESQRNADGTFSASAEKAESDKEPSQKSKNSAAEIDGKTADPAQPQAAAFERPSSWATDKANLWSGLPRDAQEYIAKREADISKGFAEYGEKNKRIQEIDSVMAPLRPMLSGLGQSDAQAIRTMIQWQQALSNPSNKVEAFKGLAKQLGLDLSSLVPAPQGQTQQTEQDPVLQQLHGVLAPTLSRLNEFDQKLSAFDQQRQQESMMRANAEISVFAKDHPYLDRVRVPMAHMMSSGLAQSLDDAYNKAIWADADIRAEIQKSDAEKRESEIKAAHEAELQKQAAAEEEKRKRDAEAATKARRAGTISPPSAVPGATSPGAGKRQKSVRDSLVAAMKESRSAV